MESVVEGVTSCLWCKSNVHEMLVAHVLFYVRVFDIICTDLRDLGLLFLVEDVDGVHFYTY